MIQPERCAGCSRLIGFGIYCCRPCVEADGSPFMHTETCQDRYMARIKARAASTIIEDELRPVVPRSTVGDTPPAVDGSTP